MLRRQSAGTLGVFAVLLGIALVAGCSKAPTPPKKPVPNTPNTDLTYAPVENDTVAFRVHFYWSGYDTDGEVVAFRWVVDPADTILANPSGPGWNRTTAKDTTLLFLVDPVQEVKRHLFAVTAEDNSGQVDPTPALRYFSAKTLPPTSKIEKGPIATNPTIGPNFTFEWSGIDPDGGETGGKAPCDSFQYMLLKMFSVADTTGNPKYRSLPAFDRTQYVNVINAADSLGLPDSLPPYFSAFVSDWKWKGTKAKKFRFRNITPGEYVFTERAVDVAGAAEKNLQWDRNIRHFTVTDKNPGPSLTVNASVLTLPLPSAIGPEDFPRKQLQIFEGETISFSWTADASFYGGEIIGYNYALDDTASLGGALDIRTTAVTLGPDKLFPGSHFLYVRCMDDGGLITNAVIPILIVHPSFRDPGAPREILYVDDFLSPGNTPLPASGFPSDATETNWYLLRDLAEPPGEARFPRITDAFPGVTVTEWDTYQRGASEDFHRKQPEPRDLASISTVVWICDANNTQSTQTALYKTLVGGSYSELSGYLRAGGTLVLSGINTVYNVSGFLANLRERTRGLCFSFEPGSTEWSLSYFPRLFMDVSYVLSNREGRRALGARDFVAAYPTAAGRSFGFDTAYVDTGIASTGAKWDTKSDIINIVPPLSTSILDQTLAPGMFEVEGWVMMANNNSREQGGSYACTDVRDFAVEDKFRPIALPIYTYHGVQVGITQDGGPSPREGRVCGLLCQSHDLGLTGEAAPEYKPSAAIGRIVFLGFPLYFLEDRQASDALFTAYSYVQASPTLP